MGSLFAVLRCLRYSVDYIYDVLGNKKKYLAFLNLRLVCGTLSNWRVMPTSSHRCLISRDRRIRVFEALFFLLLKK